MAEAAFCSGAGEAAVAGDTAAVGLVGIGSGQIKGGRAECGNLRLVFAGAWATMDGHSETPAPLCLCKSSSEDFHRGLVTRWRGLWRRA